MGNEPIKSKLCFNSRTLERVSAFSCLGFKISNEEERDLNLKLQVLLRYW